MIYFTKLIIQSVFVVDESITATVMEWESKFDINDKPESITSIAHNQYE